MSLCGLSLAAGLLTAVAPVALAAPPVHDMFASADELSGTFGTVRGSNAAATKETGEPDHASILGNKSVWYRWTAPQSGPVVFDTIWFRGGDFDTVLAVYSGDAVGTLTPVRGNDDARFTFFSRVRFATAAGSTYMIAVDGVAGKSGDFRLHWAMRPASDDFAAAERIERRAGTAVTDNTLATREAAEPSGRGTANSVWYVWTAPANRQFQFDTRGSEFDTVLTVYRGARLDRLTPVAANDDFRGIKSRVRFPARAGQTYRIAVASFFVLDAGRAVLNWQRAPR